MKSWALSIVVIVFTISIVSLLFPNGKIGKFIKSVFSFLLVFVVLKPIIKIKNNDFELDNFLVNNEIVLQDSYLQFYNNKKIKTYKDSCIKILNDCGINNAEIEFQYETDKYNKILFVSIILNLENAVINSDKEHIVIIETAKQKIKSYLNLSEEFDVLVIDS